MANNHVIIELPLPVAELNPPDSAILVGTSVDLRTVPPNVVVPKNIEDPPGVIEQGNAVIVQQDLEFERQPEFALVN